FSPTPHTSSVSTLSLHDALPICVYRLTWQGRLHALGGRDPQARWSREWDGRWRLILFDVPTAQNSHRTRLRRYLRDKCFGYLQKDRKSTRLNSSHVSISYAVFCL